MRKPALEVQFKLNISRELRRKIEFSAKLNHRSASAEAVAALEASYDEKDNQIEKVERQLSQRITDLAEDVRVCRASHEKLGQALNQWHMYAIAEGRNLLVESTAEAHLFCHIAASCRIPIVNISGSVQVEVKPIE